MGGLLWALGWLCFLEGQVVIRLHGQHAACAPATTAAHATPALHNAFGYCRGALPASLGQCPQLEELEVWNHSLWDVTRAASSLTRLTSLAVVARGNSTRAQVPCLWATGVTGPLPHLLVRAVLTR